MSPRSHPTANGLVGVTRAGGIGDSPKAYPSISFSFYADDLEAPSINFIMHSRPLARSTVSLIQLAK